MIKPWLNFAAICGIVMLIVLFCIIFGGYTSFYRAQNRIDASTKQLFDACSRRQKLLTQLTAFKSIVPDPDLIDRLITSAEKAQADVMYPPLERQPLDSGIARRVEVNQARITTDLNRVLVLIHQAGGERNKDFPAVKNQLFSAQDTLFLTWKRYAKEISYYNTRSTVFPGFLIASVFGFDEVEYPMLSKQSFLPAHKAFSPQIQPQPEKGESSS